jgi:hypothetical protein
MSTRSLVEEIKKFVIRNQINFLMISWLHVGLWFHACYTVLESGYSSVNKNYEMIPFHKVASFCLVLL